MNNKEQIKNVINYIEEHLHDEKLDLDTIAQAMGYSKYHLHRMFTAVAGFTLYQYVSRRRLSEAALLLMDETRPIIEIALISGYKTQRSFSKSFKDLYKVSPNTYRKRQQYLPLQLKLEIETKNINDGMILDVKIVEGKKIQLVGYCESTKKGFYVIGQCWRKLHQNKDQILNRINDDFLIGVNDYSHFEINERSLEFTYIASAQVSSVKEIPKGMSSFVLDESKYVVFSFRGKNEDSMEAVIEYIYREWFVNSTCIFNENNLYDFVKYGEVVDQLGYSKIEYWIPIL